MAKIKIKIKVKAKPSFAYRRFITLKGLSKMQFRKLKAGELVEIEKEHYDPEIYQEVKNGNK